jgi:hypothetical protein
MLQAKVSPLLRLAIGRYVPYLLDTMPVKLKILFVLFLILNSCVENHDNNQGFEKLIKIEITDKYLKNILTEYSKINNFEGKGIILANLRQEHDTTKYVVILILEKAFFDSYLSKKQFIFYDTIGKRIVILDTKLEPFFKPMFSKMESITILNKYLIKENKSWNEIYELEYSRKDSIVTRKVINDFMF